MNHTELPFTEPCFPGTFPPGDEAGLVPSLPSLLLAPEPCSHSSKGKAETPPAPFCAAGFSFPSAGFERLFYFWPFMEVLVITCHLLALPEGRKRTVLPSFAAELMEEWERLEEEDGAHWCSLSIPPALQAGEGLRIPAP